MLLVVPNHVKTSAQFYILFGHHDVPLLAGLQYYGR